MGRCISALFVSVLIVAMCSCAKNVVKATPIEKEGNELLAPYPQIHFPSDNDEVIGSEIPYLDENADWMKRYRDAVVILEGHCDEIGPTSYNMELGDRRARTIKAHLIERGVSYDRIIMVVSYGETRPLDPSHSRVAWQKNRRVEFVVR